MNDFQATLLAIVVIAIAGFITWSLQRRRAVSTQKWLASGGNCESCTCQAYLPRRIALVALFESLPESAELTEPQMDDMAAAIDELMHIWMAKPSLNIVQASQHLIARRFGHSTSLVKEARQKRE